MGEGSEPAGLELVGRAGRSAKRTAVVDELGRFTYERLLADSRAVAAALLGGDADLREARVAHLCWPGYRYVTTQWGIWRAGGIAVPLAVSHPEAELRYCVGHSGASVIVADPDLVPRVAGTAGRPSSTPAGPPDGPRGPSGPTGRCRRRSRR